MTVTVSNVEAGLTLSNYVIVQNSSAGNICIGNKPTAANGSFTFTVTLPCGYCNTSAISYGGTSCNPSTTLYNTRRNDGGAFQSHLRINTGATCRPAAAGGCDVADVCLAGGVCPNNFAGSATSCTGSSNGGVCDGADHCSGTANTCVDVFKGAETTCRDKVNECDVAEVCSGDNGACTAPDGFAGSDTSCTGSSQDGVCDGADHCRGSAATCVDVFKGAETTCRDKVNECDVAEVCSGDSGACTAPDGFAGSDTSCTGSSQDGVCDNDGGDHCDGGNATCVDAYQEPGTSCLGDGECTESGTCAISTTIDIDAKTVCEGGGSTVTITGPLQLTGPTEFDGFSGTFNGAVAAGQTLDVTIDNVDGSATTLLGSLTADFDLVPPCQETGPGVLECPLMVTGGGCSIPATCVGLSCTNLTLTCVSPLQGVTGTMVLTAGAPTSVSLTITSVGLELALDNNEPIDCSSGGGGGGCFGTSCNVKDGDYCSFSQGGFGGPGAPYDLLAANFGTLYPSGVVVGIPNPGDFAMTFTTAPAVQAYLPANGGADKLTLDYLNPTTPPGTNSGQFGGQTLALKLNIALSDGLAAQPGFGDLYYCDSNSTLSGMKVRDILAQAEIALGGGALPAGYSYSTLADLCANLDISFDGKSDALPVCGVASVWAKANLSKTSCP